MREVHVLRPLLDAGLVVKIGSWKTGALRSAPA